MRYGNIFLSGILDDVDVICYSNSDLDDDILDRRSTTGYLSMYLWAIISWCSKKQVVVALSICETDCLDDILSARLFDL